MWLVVGLGNPGSRYEATRHNVGFMVVDLVGDELGIGIGKKFGSSLIARPSIDGQKVILAKPQHYMNRSGPAVQELVHFYKITPERVIVIHDDLDLGTGRLRIRPGGGHGGHKGIKSIIEALGTVEFNRLRIGIGRPPDELEASDYVLGAFTDEVWQEVQAALNNARDAVFSVIFDGIDAAMNTFNTRVSNPEEYSDEETGEDNKISHNN